LSGFYDLHVVVRSGKGKEVRGKERGKGKDELIELRVKGKKRKGKRGERGRRKGEEWGEEEGGT